MPSLQSSISQFSPLFEYLNKQKEVEKNRHIFELSVTFALISFFLFFAIRPTILTISNLVGDIKAKELLSSKMKIKINQVITAQDNFAEVQEKYFLVEEALPVSPNFTGAYNQIDSNSYKSSINLDKLSFVESPDGYFSTQISTSSSFASSLGLIDSLLSSRRLIDIPQVTFSQDKQDAQGQISFILPINIFFGDTKHEKK